MVLYGLIGKKLGHSFSRNYFTEKFNKENIPDHRYDLFELPDINELPHLLEKYPELKGLNVTIPYKQKVIPYLSHLDEAAAAIEAVNTIKISRNGLKGFNTDIYGFEKSLKETVDIGGIRSALILGTGGASKAVEYVCVKNRIEYMLVSRSKGDKQITYEQLSAKPELLKKYKLIVNSTPLGMYPETDLKPPIEYHHISENHIFFDLVYNPEKTAFLIEGENHGATIKNGLDMLYYQAERAWEIWNDDNL